MQKKADGYIPEDKEERFVIMKGLIQQDITILNLYSSNNTTSKYTQQKLTY